MADRWQDALAVAEEGCKVDPASPWPALSLAAALLNLGEIREAVSRISQAAETSQYYRLVQSACWYHCALAEILDGEERHSVLQAAKGLAERSATMASLADRECQAELARTWLDLASMQDDHLEMERWSGEVQSPFYSQVLANLRANPTGRRIRLPYRRTTQKHVECVPTSISTALSAMAVHVPLEDFACEVTFGGTYEWAAADWLRQRGLHVRSSRSMRKWLRIRKRKSLFTVEQSKYQFRDCCVTLALNNATKNFGFRCAKLLVFARIGIDSDRIQNEIRERSVGKV